MKIPADLPNSEMGVLDMVVSKDNTEHYTWGAMCDGWYLLKNDNLTVIHEKMPAGRSEVKHYHEKSRQFFFVLSGKLTIITDEIEHRLSMHEGIEVHPRIIHQVCNNSESDVEFIVISNPSSKNDRIIIE